MPLPSNKDPVGNGWKYPFQIDSATGGVAWSGAPKGEVMNDTYRLQVVQQSIRLIVFTAFKSWTMRRRFGSKVYDVPFETIVRSEGLLRTDVIAAIVRWEKRITNVDVAFEQDPDNGAIDVTVSHTIIATGNPDSFTFPWYLTEQNEG